MQVVECDLMSITEGIIAHQVNCSGAIGAGLSRQIITKYPQTYAAYMAKFPEKRCRRDYLGTYVTVPINNDLIVAHVFGQAYYGNSAKTHRVYTDVKALAKALTDLVNAYPDRRVYVPHNIGCGLAGARWDDVATAIQHLPIIVCKLPN